MSIRRFVSLLLPLALAVTAASAQDKLYKVVDKYGNITYQDNPPRQDDVVVEERSNAFPVVPEAPRVTPDQRIATAAQEFPLVLFRVPQCDSCDYVSWFLERRQLPFESVDVESDIGNQMRLKDTTGEYRVPVLVIGDKPVFGFDSDSLEAGLVEAGYLEPKPQPEPAAEAGEQGAPEVIPPATEPPPDASGGASQ